jgi:hypothetical protein
MVRIYTYIHALSQVPTGLSPPEPPIQLPTRMQTILYVFLLLSSIQLLPPISTTFFILHIINLLRNLSISIMPSQNSFPAILHMRDFIDHMEQDPTRPGKSLSLQLRVSLNIPAKDIRSDDVKQDDIPTLIRFFNEGN